MRNKTQFQRELKPYKKQINEINNRRLQLESCGDIHLKDISIDLKQRIQNGISSDILLVEAFALVCEASRRILDLRPFDVQVAAGIVLHQGNIAEMQTGEGKTLAAVMPVYLNAMTGKGVHVLTFNDYLARRDAGWMGPIYEFLGLSVSFIQEKMSLRERKRAYDADVVYLTAKEAGFDFLRDQRSLDKEELVQRDFNFALIDEADSILIDEARIPMVIAGKMSPPPINPYHLAKMVRGLEKEVDYYTDEYGYDVNYTDKGLEKIEDYLGCGNLHDSGNNQIFSAANLALQAEILLKRDKDYIVREGKVELVEEFTGRVADKRRWPYGLHTAVEAKEGLSLQPEGQILGSITLKHFLALYPKLAGMTATAKIAEADFDTFYNMEVVVIPPNRSCIRIDHVDRIFTHKEAKNRALLQEIKSVHAKGRPILVGTASVEESEHLAGELQRINIDSRVLNAKNDEVEAGIIAEAGTINAVTISTNMAGRGTDIKLGGKDQKQYNEVVALGGLYVIGTNRFESRRIDHQLRGRAGRQGDPGSSRFFISLEDDLMRRYNIKSLLTSKHFPEKQDEILESPVVVREIARVQRIIEGQNFEIRKTLARYSLLVEEQRKIFQEWRKEILLETGPLPWHDTLVSKLSEQRIDLSDEEDFERLSKKVALSLMDQYWSEHLEYISHIKQGIHLWDMAGKDPSVQFGKMIIKAFDNLLKYLALELPEIPDKIKVAGIEKVLDQAGIIEPSSTWTYLVSDSFFENPIWRLIIGNNSFALGAGLLAFLYLPFLGMRKKKNQVIKK